jgi:hypothetical protein
MTQEGVCGECPICGRKYGAEELLRLLQQDPEARARVGSGLIQRVVTCPECKAKKADEDQA